MCLRCALPLSEGFGMLAKAPGERDLQAIQRFRCSPTTRLFLTAQWFQKMSTC